MFVWMAAAARIAIGVFYLLSGLNWFFGFIAFLPHVGMPPDLPIKHAVVREMIDTGWMFQSAKVIELVFGAAMLANRAVPLMLAAALPVAAITFGLDALILDDVAGWFAGTVSDPALEAAIEDMIVGGLCVLLPHLWLMWCYAAYYRPALAWKAEPDDAWHGGSKGGIGPVRAPAKPALRGAFYAFGGIALAFQSYNLVLFIDAIGG